MDVDVSVHHRSGVRGCDRTLRSTQPSTGRERGARQTRLHGVSHRPNDEFHSRRGAARRTMKKLRVLALMHDYLVPPDDVRGVDLASADWKTEYDVLKAL